MMGDSMAATSAFQKGQEGPLTGEPLQRYEDTVQVLQRDVNILTEPTSDRASKRRCLDHMKKETLGKPTIAKDPILLRHVFSVLHKPLLRCVADSVESCRETSIGLIVSFAELVDDVSSFLPYLIPAIVARLDQPEFVEPVEEVRLLLVQAIVRLIQLAEVRFSPFVEDTVKVLQRTFQDPFPDVKKESCKVVIELAARCPKALGYHGATVAKATIPALQYRQNSVRQLGLKAIRDAMIVDASAMDDLLDALRVLQLDNSQSVRDELYSTAGEWLLKLPDRWSIGYKVLPFLLSGMTDGIPKSVRLCEEYMDKVGKLYEEEWNERVKDELDYMQTEDTVATTGRPRIGSRHFARESTQKIVTLCIEGMADWNAEVRVKSAQILATFMHYSEDKVTGYTGVILPALYKVLAGDEARVMAEALNVAVSLGKYVQPDVYLEVIDPALRNGQGGSTQHRMGCLRSLEGLLRGTPPARLDAVRLERLIHALHDKELMNNENVELLAEVSSVVAEIVKLVPSTAGTVPTGNVSPTAGNAAFGVFVIITHLFSIEADDKVVGNQQTRAKCTQALQVLATAHGLFSVQDLFGVYLTAMLDRLIFTEASWTRYSPELRVLRTVLLESGPAVGQHLDVIIPLLSRIAAPDKDMEVMMLIYLIRVLDILRSHLQSRPSPLNSQSRLPAHSIPILRKIIITNAVWRPGRKLAALRTKSIDALLALLSNTEVGEGHIGLLTTGALQSSWDPDLCNVLVSTLEDDSMATRQSTLSVLDLLLQGLVFDANTFRKVYQELQKRLDDAHDELRIHVAKVWATYFTALGRWNLRMAPFVAASGTANSVLVDERGQLVQEGGGLLEIALDEVHAVAMVKGLAIHMDDTNATLQEAVFGALQVATRVLPPTVMREQLSAVRGKHRSPRYIDALLAEIPA